MAEKPNQSRLKSTTGIVRWIVFSAAVSLAALAGGRTGIAQSPRSIAEPPQAPATGAFPRSTELQIDPAGAEDPAVSFETWRRSRRLTIVAPGSVVAAHRQWVALHGGASEPAAENVASSSPVVGTNTDLPVTEYQGETAVAVNPSNAQQLVGGANTFFADSHCKAPGNKSAETQALYGTTNGGATWTTLCAPWPSSMTPDPGPALFGSDPAVAWDSKGNAYAVYLLLSQDNTGVIAGGIAIAKSTNSGSSWSPLGAVVNNLNAPTLGDDKEFVAVDTTSGGAHSHPNRIYVIWDEIVFTDSTQTTTSSQLERVAFSDDGVSWHPVQIDNDTSFADIGGNVAIGPDGTVYAVWNRLAFDQAGAQSGETTVFASSSDGGSTWTPPASIATHNLLSFGVNNTPPAQDKRGINAFPAIAVDRASSNKGNLYVVYSDFASPSSPLTDTNTYFIRSTNGGTAWSTPIEVNDDGPTSVATQFFPWVDVDQSTGNIAVSWYDTRNDTALNRKTQIFAAQSIDGGSSFQANVQVSNNSAQFANNVNFSDENSTDNGNANPNQYGDYAQIAFLNGTAHPLWCDSRNFFPANVNNPLAEDAASAQLSFGGPTPSGSPTPTATPSPVGVSLRVQPPKTSNFPPQVTLGGQGSQNPKPVNAVVSNPKTGKGSAAIQITSVQISGGGDFSFFPGSPSNPCTGTLNPGGRCTIPMAFAPTQPGIRTGTLTITDNTPAQQHTIQLRGTGRQGKLTYNPKSIGFPATAVGSTSASKPIKLRNNNPVALSLGSPSVDNPDFILSGSCLGSISPKSGCELDVNFKPSQHAKETGTLTIPDDAAGAPHQVKLTGAGK